MSDLVTGALGVQEPSDNGAAAAAAAGGDGGGQGGASAPAWMAGLADEGMRADPELSRYATIDDLAKGFKETRTWARGRVAIPNAETDDNGWREFGERLRPEKATDYDIPLLEGSDTAMADKYREFAHGLGMPARWAKANAEFHNQFISDSLSRVEQQAKDGMKAVELEMGGVAYNQRMEATENMMKAHFGGDFDVITNLTTSLGAEKTLRFLFSMAEKTGELGKVDSTDVSLRMGGMTPESAQGEINRLSGDTSPAGKAWMQQAKIKGTPEHTRWNALNDAAAGPKK
ncbi:hypothetical protein [Novosphingobium sp.]|uniref:hypothetical protein n=1 Tax=Novosphingobium sp. TaxID=1874826 RepID=UPI0031D33F19